MGRPFFWPSWEAGEGKEAWMILLTRLGTCSLFKVKTHR